MQLITNFQRKDEEIGYAQKICRNWFFYKHIYFFLINITFLLILCHKGIKFAFGKVTFDQILFHLNVPAETVDPSTYKVFIYFIAIYIVFLAIHTYIFINFIHRNNNIKKIYNDLKICYNILIKIIKLPLQKKQLTYFIIGVLAFVITLSYIDKKYNIKNYYNAEASSFIEKNYYNNTISFNKKKNLVLIFLESMEKGYSNATVMGKNLIPELEELSKNNISFSGHTYTHGSGWTQAALVNMLLGIPLMWPTGVMETTTQTSNINKFLPHAVSLPRTLHSNGYSVNMFLGSSPSFSDKDKLFSTHNIDKVYDKHYFDNNGYNKKENNGTGWGYKDSFIYAQAFEEYKKLSSENKPFSIIIETVDTHFPDGYVEEHQKKFNDIRDAIRQSSIMCSDFIKKLYEYNNLNDTTVVIIGDHPWMMNYSASFTKKMDKISPREIYNVFINSCLASKDIQTQRQYASFDIAPTILEAIGANLQDHRFALGTSLFSKEKTLLEKYGADYVNGELVKQSPFYLNLF